MTIGIERIATYVPGEAMRLETLAAARGVSLAAFEGGRGRRAFALAAPCEDVVSVAATAGARVLRDAVAPASIGLLLVASARAGARERPVAGHVHGLLGLGSRCRAVDVVGGCYASTAAVMMAHDWVQAGGYRNRCALVIAADVVRARPHSPHEVGQGAAGVAMVIGLAPQLLILSEDGVQVASRSGAGRRSYRAALTEAFGVLRHAERPVLDASEGLTDRLAQMYYQAGSPATAIAAHQHVLQLDWQQIEGRSPAEPASLTQALADADALQLPWLDALADIGDTRAAAIWLALAAGVEAEGRRLGGRRIGAFAFDRRAGGELFTGLVPAAVGMVADTGLGTALAGRTFLDADEYSRRNGELAGGNPPTGFTGDFLYVTTQRGQRVYVARQ